jgi:hypothetical protein
VPDINPLTAAVLIEPPMEFVAVPVWFNVHVPVGNPLRLIVPEFTLHVGNIVDEIIGVVGMAFTITVNV